MEQVQGLLAATADEVSAAAKGIAYANRSRKQVNLSKQKRRRQQLQQSSSSLHGGDIEQAPTESSQRPRRRPSILERHEQFLSQRGNLSSDSIRNSFREQPSSYKRKWLPRQMMPSQRTSHRKEEKENSTESTPLMQQQRQQRQIPRQSTSNASSESSFSLSPPPPPWKTTKKTSPKPKNRHWAKIKGNIEKGNFLVKEVLSKDSELLDIDAAVDSEETQASSKSVEILRQEAIENFQKGSTFSPQLCLLAIALYMIISVFMFCFFLEPQWSVIDSCYFAVSTFTTLGYGDLSPTSTISVIFTTVYALAGVACLGLALGILGSRLLETKEDSKWHENFAQEYEALTLFDGMGDSSYHYDSDSDCGYFDPVESDTSSGSEDPMTVDDLVPSSSSRSGSSENDEVDKTGDKNIRFCSSVEEKDSADNDTMDNVDENVQAPSSVGDSSFSSRRDRRQSAKNIDTRKSYNVNLRRFLVLLTITMIFAILIGKQSHWTIYDTFYYTVTTAATIGYGDLTPHTQEERFLAIFFIPLACAVTGHCLAFFAKWIIEKQGAKYRKATFDSHRELSPEDLRVMDITGDGKVAWFEFLEFMLVAMKKVDPELLDELRDYFDRLDVANTGELSKDDLIEMARRKMKSPRRKLELHAYKQHLLEISHNARNQPQAGNDIGGWFERGLDFLGMSSRNLNFIPDINPLQTSNMATVKENPKK